MKPFEQEGEMQMSYFNSTVTKLPHFIWEEWLLNAA